MRRTLLLYLCLLVALFNASCAESGDDQGDGSVNTDTAVADGTHGEGWGSDVDAVDAGPDQSPVITNLPNQPGGNPLVPEVAMYPYPCDFFLVDDSSTKTGRRVEIPAQVLPPGLGPLMFNSADGFSRVPMILAYLAGGIDEASLPDILDPGATLAQNSSVLLVRADTGEKVPALVELDHSVKPPARQALIIRPHRALAPATSYVVILRDGLLTLAGAPHQPSDAYRALRDGLLTDSPELERQREDFKLVQGAINALGLKPEEVVQAWSFSTRSEQQVVDPTLAMQAAADAASVGAYTVLSDGQDASGTNRVIKATFDAPNFISPQGVIKLDGQGNPTQFGQRKAEFIIVIPETIDEPRPVVLYGHGFFGDKMRATEESFNKLIQTHRFVALATNFIGFSEADKIATIAVLTTNLSQIDSVVAKQLQSHVHFTMLARLAKTQLYKDFIKDIGSGPFEVMDPDQVHYYGESNGGTQGMVIASTSPAFSRAALLVPGGGIAHLLQRSADWSSMDLLIRLVYPKPLELQLALALIQLNLDPMDGLNYVEHLVANRFSGLGPLKASVHMVLQDAMVPNVITEWVARTAALPLITPSPKAVWGLKTVSAPPPAGAPTGTNGALHVYDLGYAPLSPYNKPPGDDNGAHKAIRFLDVCQQHVATFLEHGQIVQLCNGACDPD